MYSIRPDFEMELPRSKKPVRHAPVEGVQRLSTLARELVIGNALANRFGQTT